jgi:hypothetical protein
MKRIQIARLIPSGLFVVSAAAQHQTSVLDPPVTGGTLPYEITLREISLAPATVPTLHSAVAAVWQDQWVLLAGSTNGLHGMTGNNAFDPQYQNSEVWVIDPATLQSWHKSLVETSSASGLSADAVDSLSSVNINWSWGRITTAGIVRFSMVFTPAK